jgi:competence protein ComEA
VNAGRVDINTATVTELETLPGIGPTAAQAIVDYRLENGPFQAIEDIQNVPGIGPATYDGIRDYITIGN